MPKKILITLLSIASLLSLSFSTTMQAVQSVHIDTSDSIYQKIDLHGLRIAVVNRLAYKPHDIAELKLFISLLKTHDTPVQALNALDAYGQTLPPEKRHTIISRFSKTAQHLRNLHIPETVSDEDLQDYLNGHLDLVTYARAPEINHHDHYLEVEFITYIHQATKYLIKQNPSISLRAAWIAIFSDLIPTLPLIR